MGSLKSFLHLSAVMMSSALLSSCGKIPSLPRMTPELLGIGAPSLVEGEVPFADTMTGGTYNNLIPVFNDGIRNATIVSITYTSSVFTTKGNTECMVGSVIKPGVSCALSVDFKPVASHTYAGVLRIVYSGANQTFTAVYQLRGNGF